MSFTPYPNQRMLIVPERARHTVECGRTVNRRTRLALHAPTPAFGFGRRTAAAAFGRSLPSAAVDRGSRPSAAAADRGIEIVLQLVKGCVS